MKALVINGPNLNMLGIREPGIYGSDNYDRLVQICQEAGAAQASTRSRSFQSNHEGSIVGQDPGGLRQGRRHRHQPGRLYAYERGDPRCLKAVAIPAVEIHISAVETRETSAR